MFQYYAENLAKKLIFLKVVYSRTTVDFKSFVVFPGGFHGL